MRMGSLVEIQRSFSLLANPVTGGEMVYFCSSSERSSTKHR